MRTLLKALQPIIAGILLLAHAAGAEPLAAGASGSIGCAANAKQVERLVLDKSGVYENYKVDGKWAEHNLVKITANDVTLRNSDVLNGRHNGIVVYAENVVIDSCRIHHLLKGTFESQQDAHGIT